MGTRGFIGFVADGGEKIAYNHFDSYPGGLGIDMLGWLRFAVGDLENPAGGVDALRERVRAIRVVDGSTTPTPEDIERLSEWANTRVSRQSLDDWYCLLRETQGNPGNIVAAGVLIDSSDFPRDSLFAEWGYVVDLDASVFEAYKGFQKTRPEAGRFKDREPVDHPRGGKSEYYPVALAASWPLDTLPPDEEFLAALEGGEDA
jgi:hypothetical protein